MPASGNAISRVLALAWELYTGFAIFPLKKTIFFILLVWESRDFI
jgi:hypothetical protein